MSPHDVFYTGPDDISADRLVLRGEEHRHLRGSLRKRAGDLVAVVDGRGTCYEAELVRVDRDSSEARILTRQLKWGEPRLRLTILTAVPKGSRIEFVIEKGTELGVCCFVPLRSRRSVAGASPAKVGRWQRLALAAMKQSRRSVLPDVLEEMSFEEALDRFRTVPLKLVAHAEGSGVRQAGSDLGAEEKVGEAVVLIGPEGGLTGEEVALAVEAGFMPLALGRRRLRVETASLVAATLILHAAGELEPPLEEADR